MGWHAALAKPGAAWDTLELRLKESATEESLQASLPRLRAIGSLTTSLDFTTPGWLPPQQHRQQPSLDRASSPDDPRRELQERALALILPALPRLRACRAPRLPLTGPALGPLLQHPTLQEVSVGLGAPGLDVDTSALQRFGAESAASTPSQLRSVMINLTGSLSDRWGRFAVILEHLAALKKVPCLHLEVQTGPPGVPEYEMFYGHCMPEAPAAALAALTNLRSLVIGSESGKSSSLGLGTDEAMRALVYLSRVELDCEWMNTKVLSTLPALKQVKCVMRRWVSLPLTDSLWDRESAKYLSRLEALTLAFEDLEYEEGFTDPGELDYWEAKMESYGVKASWDAMFAERTEREDQDGYKLPRVRALSLEVGQGHAASFCWGSMSALTSLRLLNYTCRGDGVSRLPDFPYLEGLVELELEVKLVLPAQLSRTTRLRSLAVSAPGVTFCKPEAAQLLAGLGTLCHLSLAIYLDSLRQLSEKESARLSKFVGELPPSLKVDVRVCQLNVCVPGWVRYRGRQPRRLRAVPWDAAGRAQLAERERQEEFGLSACKSIEFSVP